MSRFFAICFGLCLVAAVLLAFYAKSLYSELQVSAIQNEFIVQKNKEYEAAAKKVEAGKKRDEEIVEKKLSQDEELKASVRRLESKLQGVLNNAKYKEKQFTFDSVLPRDAIDALCLQWHEASGFSSRAAARATAGAADARAQNTPTTRGDYGHSLKADCRAWHGLTLRAVIEWSGLLLTHAGHERLDKNALREWRERVQVQ